MSDSERTQYVKEMIRGHLRTVGPTRWKAVRLQCDDISDATFWRHVKAVRSEARSEEIATEDGPSTTVPTDEVPRLGALPAFYNPLQKARLYDSLLEDAEFMRAQAVNHRGRIINWRMFEKSIQHRERLIAQQAEFMDYFQNQEVLAKFFEQVIEILEDLPKDVVHKLIARLYEFQKQRLGPSKA